MDSSLLLVVEVESNPVSVSEGFYIGPGVDLFSVCELYPLAARGYKPTRAETICRQQLIKVVVLAAADGQSTIDEVRE